MLYARTKTCPETPAALYLVIVGSTVVIGANRGTCGQVALSHYQCRYQKGIVVVLFVSGEYQIIEHLTAGNRGIVAHK